jgi:hypothetical protein
MLSVLKPSRSNSATTSAAFTALLTVPKTVFSEVMFVVSRQPCVTGADILLGDAVAERAGRLSNIDASERPFEARNALGPLLEAFWRLASDTRCSGPPR